MAACRARASVSCPACLSVHACSSLRCRASAPFSPFTCWHTQLRRHSEHRRFSTQVNMPDLATWQRHSHANTKTGLFYKILVLYNCDGAVADWSTSKHVSVFKRWDSTASKAAVRCCADLQELRAQAAPELPLSRQALLRNALPALRRLCCTRTGLHTTVTNRLEIVHFSALVPD